MDFITNHWDAALGAVTTAGAVVGIIKGRLRGYIQNVRQAHAAMRVPLGKYQAALEIKRKAMEDGTLTESERERIEIAMDEAHDALRKALDEADDVALDGLELVTKLRRK